MSVQCPDCGKKIYYGTEHMGGRRYLAMRPKELKRAVLRNRLNL